MALATCLVLGASACSSSAGKGDASGGAGGVADGKPLDPSVPVTISIDCAPGADQAALKAAYADDLQLFKVQYPNVTINNKPYVGQCEDPSQFTAQLKAHSETDAFHTYFTDKQAVLDSGDAIDITKYVNDQTVPGYSTMLPTVQAAMKDGDHVYSIPRNYYNSGLVYNRNLFKQAGLDPDKPPTTWAEVEADAAKISALGNGISGYEDYSGGNTGGWHFTSELYSLGGKMVTDDGKKAAFNSEQGKAVLQRLYDMRWKSNGIGATPVTQWPDAFPPLAGGKVGMFIGAPDVLQHLVEVLSADKSQFGLGPIPGATGPAASTLAGGDLYYFKKGLTPNQIKALIAWIDFEYLTPGQGTFNYARTKALATSDRPVALGFPQPYFWAASSPQMATITTALKANATLPYEQYTSYVNNPVPGAVEPPAAQQLYKVLDTAMSAVMTDQNANIGQLLSTAETQANQVLANQ